MPVAEPVHALQVGRSDKRRLSLGPGADLGNSYPETAAEPPFCFGIKPPSQVKPLCGCRLRADRPHLCNLAAGFAGSL